MRIAMVNPDNSRNPGNWGTSEGAERGWGRRAEGRRGYAAPHGARYPRGNPYPPDDPYFDPVSTPYGKQHLSFMSQRLSELSGSPEDRMKQASREWRGIRERHGSPQPRHKIPTSAGKGKPKRKPSKKEGKKMTANKRKPTAYNKFFGKQRKAGKSPKQIGQMWKRVKKGGAAASNPRPKSKGKGKSNPANKSNFFKGTMRGGKLAAFNRTHRRDSKGRFLKKGKGGGKKGRRKSNPANPANKRKKTTPWTRFVKQHAGQGLSMKKMGQMYRGGGRKSNPSNPANKRKGRKKGGKKGGSRRKKSAYNKFFGKYRKQGYSAKQIGKMWRKGGKANPEIAIPGTVINYPTDAPFGDLSLRNFRANFPTMEEIKHKPVHFVGGLVNGFVWAGTLGGFTRVLTMKASPIVQEVASLGGSIVGTEVGAWVVPKIMDFANVEGGVYVKKATRLSGYGLTLLSAVFGLIRIAGMKAPKISGEYDEDIGATKVGLTDKLKDFGGKIKDYFKAGIGQIYEPYAVPGDFIEGDEFDYWGMGQDRSWPYDPRAVAGDWQESAMQDFPELQVEESYLDQKISQLRSELGVSGGDPVTDYELGLVGYDYADEGAGFLNEDLDTFAEAPDLDYPYDEDLYYPTSDHGVGDLPYFIDDDDEDSFVY